MKYKLDIKDYVTKAVDSNERTIDKDFTLT